MTADPEPLACAQCGGAVTIAADRMGVARYAHEVPAADGHEAALLPVTVTYRRDGIWHEADSPELGGHLISAMDPDAPRMVAATLLRRLVPARSVREICEGYDGEPGR